MPAARLVPLLGFALLLPAVAAAADTQTHFRVRADFSAALNADSGWAAPLDAPATVFADRPFRLRFEVLRAPDAAGPASYRLHYRRNAGAWTPVEAHDFPHPESKDARSPRVSLVACAAYPPGAPTADLLVGSPAPFRAGTGPGLADRTPAWSGAGAHGEFEFALVARRFADGAVTNDPGDTFEFRLVAADGAPLLSARNPVLTLAVPPGHLGGTFVETPGRIGPWAAGNGDLYFIMEPAETSNLFMMVKSADGGRTWREVDAAHRPASTDLEAVDAQLVGATVHILHQITPSSHYHAFHTSDHPTSPDTWAVRDKPVATAKASAQAASLVVRSDGSLVAFYTGPAKIHTRTCSPAGVWGAETVIDATLAPNLAGPQAVLGARDTVHLAYYGTDGTVWYRRLRPDGTLTPRESLATGLSATRADFGSVLPLVFIPRTDTAVVLYRLPTGIIWERRIVGEGPPTPAVPVTDRPVVQNAVDSQQPAADVVLDGEQLLVAFVEAGSRSIFTTRDGGGWQPSTLRVDRILGTWIRGQVYRRPDGVKVYAFVYDAGSDGGAGMNRFGSVILDETFRPPP